MFQEANEELNFEEQILEAAKSIAGATAALVKAASSAQRELIMQGKVGAYNGDVDDDSQWSQGLISAVSCSAFFRGDCVDMMWVITCCYM